MRKVLVTGATGFIGRQALPFLLDNGYEVHATHAGPVPTDTSGVKWHKADLLDPNDTARVFTDVRPTHLIHFACM